MIALIKNCNYRLIVIAAIGSAILSAAVGAAVANSPEHIISQKGKSFGPHDVGLHSGGDLTIVNDDGSLIHYDYIDAPDLVYDSGDMEPGSKAVIIFPNAGNFTVLCGIHPKMKLTVRVQ